MRRAFCFALSLIALLLVTAPARGDERILDYHADIQIAADGGMTVHERIRVASEGKRIRHGIYRDFPTRYRDRNHHRVHIDFSVKSASLDGAPVTWDAEPHRNGVRVKLGDAARTLGVGEHTFELTYSVNREIGFFADHDELYWNVTGSDWDFAIDRASASVTLPTAPGQARLQAAAYAGAKGATGGNVAIQLGDNGATYTTTAPLAAHENLSIVLGFPKGIVTPPTRMEKAGWLLRDNRSLLWGLAGLVVLWLYYMTMWHRVGRDPAPGPLVAEYEPPDGDSAAALRYVRRMGYDNTCFTAAILGLAAHGQLTISRRDDDTWMVRKKPDAAATEPLTADQQALLGALFADGDELVFESAEHTRVSAASTALKAALKKTFKKRFFHTNGLYLLPGLAITVIALLLGARDDTPVPTLFVLMWLSIWSVAVAGLAHSAINAPDGKAKVILWIMTAVFGLGEIGGLVMLSFVAGLATVPVFLALVATNVAFYFWMRAPTAIGAKLLDRVNGFRWYLGVAEKQELDARYQPESRPDLFAAYLPYALALDVGNAWAQRFSDALTPAQMHAAQPSWYVGGGLATFNAASFASMTSDLSSGLGGAIASSSVSPGSSSGFGGGGFSGGGGGGGGGGGW